MCLTRNLLTYLLNLSPLQGTKTKLTPSHCNTGIEGGGGQVPKHEMIYASRSMHMCYNPGELYSRELSWFDLICDLPITVSYAYDCMASSL